MKKAYDQMLFYVFLEMKFFSKKFEKKLKFLELFFPEGNNGVDICLPEIFWQKFLFPGQRFLDLPQFFNQKKFNSMYSGIVHLHSGLRWIVLGLLIFVIFRAYRAWKSGEGFSDKDKKMNLYALIATHIQVLTGFYLYFTSMKVSFVEGWMKNPVTRFFGMEHIMMMLIGAILITIGNSKGKRTEGAAGAKSAFWFFLIGLIVILSRIPWPWQAYGAGWG